MWDSKGTGPIEYVLEAHKSRVSVILCIGDETYASTGAFDACVLFNVGIVP